MISLFSGLSAANLLLLCIVFMLGLSALDTNDEPSNLYIYHVTLGIAAGLLATLTHIVVYTYFMATSKWLRSAVDKADLDPNQYVVPSLVNKRRVFGVVIIAVATTMLSMFAGAGADPTVKPWWSGQVHLIAAALAMAANLFCALVEYSFICNQRRLMDQALAVLNRPTALDVANV